MMTSTKPYLIRAFYEWIADNNCTPHLVVNTELPNVEVPREYVEKNGQIVLNIAMVAVHGLELGNDDITFQARFSGTNRTIFVPIGAVIAIYARENGRGMVFSEDEDEPPPDSHLPPPVDEDEEDSGNGANGKTGGRPNLHIVK